MGIIIAFISQKGGVGKSTLARACARELANNQISVKVADLDIQQGTCIEWGRTRLSNDIEPSVPVAFYKTVQAALADSGNYDSLVIDGPARVSAATLEIAKTANLIIQPSGASVDDLRPAVKEFHGLVNNHIPKSKMMFILNRIGTTAEEENARSYIQEAGYEVLEGCLFEKPAYRKAQNLGYSITETKYKALNEKADILIQNLINKIVTNG